MSFAAAGLNFSISLSTITPKTIEAKNTSLDKKETSASLVSEAPKEVSIAIVEKKDTAIAVKKDSTIEVKAVKDTASNYINQASLPINNIKGIESSKNNATITEIKMNSIGKDTAIVKKPITPVKDTIAKKPTSIYPDKPFKINQVAVIWAKAGISLLQIATEHNISLYKVFVFNDLKETDLLAQDQLLFLANKKAEGDKSFHLKIVLPNLRSW